MLQSDDLGSSLSDPLNVIPDEYEEDYLDAALSKADIDINNDVEFAYDEYDPSDIPEDQARPEKLSTYEFAEQPAYGGDAEQPAYGGNAETPIPNLRETVEFSTIGVVEDVAVTTYSPEIDFNLGTTSAQGIEVVNLVTAVENDSFEYLDDGLASANDINDVDVETVDLRNEYEYDEYDPDDVPADQAADEYEYEELNSYQPTYKPVSADIPIVVEEPITVDLPSYDPVVLLVGTPVKVGSSHPSPL